MLCWRRWPAEPQSSRHRPWEEFTKLPGWFRAYNLASAVSAEALSAELVKFARNKPRAGQIDLERFRADKIVRDYERGSRRRQATAWSLSTWQLTAVQLRRPISLAKSREFTPMDGFRSLKWSPNPIVYAVFIGIALILSARNLYIALDDAAYIDYFSHNTYWFDAPAVRGLELVAFDHRGTAVEYVYHSDGNRTWPRGRFEGDNIY